MLYDRSIHKLAEKEGFAAFSGGNSELLLRHYRLENMHSSASAKANKQGKGVFIKEERWPCYNFNKKDGCTFGHWCSKCSSTAHNKVKCKKD